MQAELEELYHNSPRRRLLAECAKSLADRFPTFSEEIGGRLAALTEQWEAAEKLITSLGQKANFTDSKYAAEILAQLAADLAQLQTWLAKLIRGKY